MKLRALLAVSLVGLCQMSFAKMPPKPAKCPAVSALKSSPFLFAQKPDEAPGYVAATMGSYGTKDQWAFVMAFIEADNMASAVMTANKELPNVYGNPEPFPVEDQEVWFCGYGVKGTPYQAIAITPLNMGGIKQATSLVKRAA